MPAVVAVFVAVVAHQGGWDEILLISVPVLLIGGALWVAKRRVEASTSAEVSEPRSHPDVDG